MINLKTKRVHKYNKQKLTSSEVDFLKTRFNELLSVMTDTLTKIKHQAKQAKNDYDYEVSDQHYAIYRKVKEEQTKIASIQRKLKRGLS